MKQSTKIPIRNSKKPSTASRASGSRASSSLRPASFRPERSTSASRSSSAKRASMGKYSSLMYRFRTHADRVARKKAEDLAKLPKDPIPRFFARLHPKRVVKSIFSFDGLKTLFKFAAACFLLGIIFIGGLFLYFKKDLAAIRLDKLEVAETVNTYLDRNGEILWEDKGDGDYRLVADGKNISSYMRQATVAIEDKKFYNHSGVDFLAIIRAALSIATRQGVQGGSTLTQQLIKQVYFPEEAAKRGFDGIPRKIKEAILALEVEKMYDKEQLITMYLNESPYGGPRNGVESAARAYFGKSANTLTLAESALLAAIPNNPARFNPYNTKGHKALLERQHKTLDSMVEMGYISADDAAKAKAVPILDQIKTEESQYKNIKAPHYVLEVKKQLEAKYGVKTMRVGGFTIKTTLDYRAQKIAEEAVAAGSKLMTINGSNNISLSSVDVETGQVIAMVGSSGWDKPVYGQVNASTALLEPGSSIKPILDYAPLFTQRGGQNFGPGSILRDENIDSLYCSGYSGACRLRNYTGAFYGNVTIRQSLANSLNIAAVKALYINGVDNSLKIARDLGDHSYCPDNHSAGLSIAIGSGCNVRPIEHANAYASLARGGVYKPLTYILEIKNSSGNIIESWSDTKGKRVIDDQSAFLVLDILGDANARRMVFGAMSHSFGFKIPNVWTASKTGTTTTNISTATKDSWIASVSPAVATVIWNGNHDGTALRNSSNDIVRRVVHNYMSDVHLDIYEKDGRWQKNQQPIRPKGIQELTVNGRKDFWPSWYSSKTSGTETTEMTFNKYSKKLATECTPKAHRIDITISKVVDPITKHTFWHVPEPYNREIEDDCTYRSPSARLDKIGNSLIVYIDKGSEKLTNYELLIDDEVKETGVVKSTSFSLDYRLTGNEKTIKISISDEAGFTATDEL